MSRLRKCSGLALLLLLVPGLRAEGEGMRSVSRAEYRQELVRMGAVVEACRAQATACDGKAVPPDERVSDEDGAGEFRVRWDWLREALKKGSDVQCANAKGTDRGEVLERAAARLREDAAASAGTSSEAADEVAARGKLEEVLARREFGAVQETRWWERLLAKVYGHVEEWWGRMAGAVPWSPWMGLALEWGVLGAAAVALLVWALRMSRQQRVSFEAHREQAPAWQAESDDWAARAKEEAAKGEWREAVHCLYWSAIVMLEGQRLWRQNRARTPREYVALLEPGSARRRLLGGLTGVFERIWYGIRPATGEDYAKASALLDELRVG